MAALPSSLALTSIADNALAVAADLRNNYVAIQSAVNALITALSGGAAGQKLEATDSTHVQWTLPPAYEFAYNEFTANVSVTATTEGTANTVVTASAVTFDGATVALIEFSSPGVTKGTTNVALVLYDGAAAIGVLGVVTASDGPVRVARRLTPAAAAKTYSVRAYVDAGTGTVTGGAGGAGARVPGFIKITKV